MSKQIKSGIYVITNTTTGDCYIGSSKDVEKRMNQHRDLLRMGQHHSHVFQAAWNQYGEDVFVFDALEIVAAEKDLIGIEQRYLDERQPAYNSAKIALRNGAGLVRAAPVKYEGLSPDGTTVLIIEKLHQRIADLQAVIQRGDDIMSVLNAARNLTPAERGTIEQFAKLAIIAYSKGLTSGKDFFGLINAIVTGLYDERTITEVSSYPQAEDWSYYLSNAGFAALSVGTLLVSADISQMERPTNQDMLSAGQDVGREIRALLLKHGIRPEDMPPQPHISDTKRIAASQSRSS